MYFQMYSWEHFWYDVLRSGVLKIFPDHLCHISAPWWESACGELNWLDISLRDTMSVRGLAVGHWVKTKPWGQKNWVQTRLSGRNDGRKFQKVTPLTDQRDILFLLTWSRQLRTADWAKCSISKVKILNTQPRQCRRESGTSLSMFLVRQGSWECEVCWLGDLKQHCVPALHVWDMLFSIFNVSLPPFVCLSVHPPTRPFVH